MDRVAVFVDAGYLYAAGSALIAGSKQRRSLIKLNEDVLIAHIEKLAKDITQLPLLRIYWYDGTTGRLSTEQLALAHKNNIKMRLGLLNSVGEQKGVDSLIVIDLIELARNHSISDAILLSGDEDVRVGVQVAQSFGVRVHLLGIHPARGSQSRTLQQESDTTHEMDKAAVSAFLSVHAPAPTEETATVLPPFAGAAQVVALNKKAPIIEQVAVSAAPTAEAARPHSDYSERLIEELLAPLSGEDLTKLSAVLDSNPGVPKEFDGKLLARLRAKVGRDLEPAEKSAARRLFFQKVRARAQK